MTSPVDARRAALLALAKDAGIRLKNVPGSPTLRWLDAAEHKVKQAIAAQARKRRERREALLAKASSAGIRLKRVPLAPSDAWLTRAEAKVDAAIAQRAAKAQAPLRAPDPVANPRLASLLGRARTLGVRIRKVPDEPSERWLDKLEAKLTDLERQRSLPPPPDPSTTMYQLDEAAPSDPAATIDGVLPPAGVPSAVDTEAVEQRALGDRVGELIQRAERAGLELGRVPPNPTEEWVVSTEAALEDVLERRREARRAARAKKAARRKARIQELLALADRHRILIEHIPPFPTEDWIARTELMVHERAYADEDDDTRRNRLADQRRRERLNALLERAERGGFDIGTLPPDPDEEWLTEAEERVAQRELEASEVLEAGGATQESRPRLVYEEGTLQEEIKFLETDDLTIGRQRANAIQVRNDAHVSRQHARLWVVDDVWYVADLDSTRGTHVNGVRIQGDVALEDGAEVQVGETRFVFRR